MDFRIIFSFTFPETLCRIDANRVGDPALSATGTGSLPGGRRIFPQQGQLHRSLIYFLSTRSVQFAVTLVLDVLIIYLLLRARIFERMGIWPPVAKEKSFTRKDRPP